MREHHGVGEPVQVIDGEGVSAPRIDDVLFDADAGQALVFLNDQVALVSSLGLAALLLTQERLGRADYERILNDILGDAPSGSHQVRAAEVIDLLIEHDLLDTDVELERNTQPQQRPGDSP